MTEGHRLRVGLIAPPWLPVPPLAYGGTESVLDTLARGLADAGAEVVLFASGDSTCPVPLRSAFSSAPGVDIGGVAVETHHVLAAYAALRDVDVIHDHTSIGPLVSRLRATAPVVTTNHNPFAVPFSSVFEAVSRDVSVVAISEHHARTAVGVEIAAVIHHGVDAALFPVGSGTGGYAVFLGRMSPQKGVHRAIEIARRAGMPIMLAGKQHSEAERDYFESEIRPRLGDGVEYVGEIDAAAKLELLGDAVALVNPISWDEPFGMVMVEALACGTPVLACPVGAAPEIVVDGVTGFLAEDDDLLVDRLGRVSEIDRSACRAAVEGHFSQQRMVAEHLALYERVIKLAGQGPSR